MTNKLPDSKEVRAFLDAIRENPFDDTARLVFADYLQEVVPEETALIAAYRGGAKKHLEDFCARAVGYYHPDNWYNAPPDPDDEDYRAGLESHESEKAFFTYEYVVRAVLDMFRRNDHALPVGPIQQAGRMLADADERRAFWDAVEVITGYHVPTKFRGESYTVCSC
jgi:uncharacterized protein (TIGR02996 family)